MEEVTRVLAPHGVVVLSSHMDSPIHNHPSDYWRFTPACFALLLSDFRMAIVGTGGDPNFPTDVFGVGFKSSVDVSQYLADLRRRFDYEPARDTWAQAKKKAIKDLLGFESLRPPRLKRPPKDQAVFSVCSHPRAGNTNVAN